jgi:hypothetical protein
MLRKLVFGLLTLAAVALVAPTAASARGGGGMVAAVSTAVDSMVAVAGMAAASAVDFAVLE